VTVEEDVESTSQPALENKSWHDVRTTVAFNLVGDGQGKRDSSDT